MVEIIPGDVIILSGMLSFYDNKLRKKYKLKIFLDTDEDVRLSKRGMIQYYVYLFFSISGCYN